jgi:hypothetical protein
MSAPDPRGRHLSSQIFLATAGPSTHVGKRRSAEIRRPKTGRGGLPAAIGIKPQKDASLRLGKDPRDIRQVQQAPFSS